MDLTTIIVAVIGSGVLNTLLSYVIAVREKKKNSQNGLKEAMRLIMKDRLRFLGLQYIQQGWIYEDELDDIIEMHKSYHDDLDGNGFLNDIMNKVRNLEIKVRG